MKEFLLSLLITFLFWIALHIMYGSMSAGETWRLRVFDEIPTRVLIVFIGFCGSTLAVIVSALILICSM